MTEWLEQAWLDRYLARQLKPEENDWFEAYMLDKTELLEQVEVDSDLRHAFLASSAGEDSAATPGATPPAHLATADAISGDHENTEQSAARIRSSAPVRARTRQSDQHARSAVSRGGGRQTLALAASLVLAIAAGWIGHARMQPDVGAGLVEASPTRIVFDTLRGAPTAPGIENPAGPSRFALIEIGVPANASGIHIRIGTRPPLPLRLSTDGFASFLVEKSVLRQQPHATLHYVVDGRPIDSDLNLELP
jgi:hypothetical protein